MQFMVGDVVRLKSGGPKMTVVEATGDGWVTCVWFNPDGKKDTGTFPESGVEK
jgi:uncharacterized protein YodC (DUF2158 family)